MKSLGYFFIMITGSLNNLPGWGASDITKEYCLIYTLLSPPSQMINRELLKKLKNGLWAANNPFFKL
jgi:hypothetical protein